MRLPWNQKPVGSLISRYILRQPIMPLPEVKAEDLGQCMEKGEQPITIRINLATRPSVSLPDDATQARSNNQLSRHTARLSGATYKTFRSPATQIRSHPSSPLSPHPNTHTPASAVASLAEEDKSDSFRSGKKSVLPYSYRILREALSGLYGPIATTLIISLVIAFIQPLKALFVDVSQRGGPKWRDPDGRPPLAFIINAAGFIGQAVSPLALIILGASFYRLKLPHPLSRLPILAMVAVTLAKMLIRPIVGVLVVQGMVKSGLIDRDARVEKFVAMFLSGTPGAINQLIVSSIYAPDGNMDTLAAFLLMQYIFMFFKFSSSALSAVALLLS